MGKRYTAWLLALCLTLACPLTVFADEANETVVMAEAEAEGGEAEEASEAAETQAPETQAPETQAPETQAPETQAPETQAPETKTPETKTPETKAPETKQPETSETSPGKSGESESEQETEEEEASTSVEGVPVRAPSDIELSRYVNSVFMRTVVKQPFYTLKDLDILEEKKDDARTVGRLPAGGVCYKLALAGDGWLFVESGTVRGFVRLKALTRTMPVAEEAPGALNGELSTDHLWSALTPVARQAEEVLPPRENKALLFTRTTTRPVVTAPEYALAAEDTAILENTYDPAQEDAEKPRTIGSLKAGGLVCVLETTDENWVYVCSGTVRGYALKAQLTMGAEAAAQVEEKGAGSFALADEKVPAEENAAFYDSFRSLVSGVPHMKAGEAAARLALDCVGMSGSAFSGSPESFVNAVYAAFDGAPDGDAADPESYASAGEKGSLQTAGDLVVFSRELRSDDPETEEDETLSRISAGVAVGDGSLVYASDEGIQRLAEDDFELIAARSLIDKTMVIPASTDVHEDNAPEESYGKYLGNFALTYYCPCAQCCDVATGQTSTGVIASQGETIAVDPSVIPYGSLVIVNGHIFKAQDTGGGIRGNHIDIYLTEHSGTLQQSIVTAEVYLLKD